MSFLVRACLWMPKVPTNKPPDKKSAGVGISFKILHEIKFIKVILDAIRISKPTVEAPAPVGLHGAGESWSSHMHSTCIMQTIPDLGNLEILGVISNTFDCTEVRVSFPQKAVVVPKPERANKRGTFEMHPHLALIAMSGIGVMGAIAAGIIMYQVYSQKF